MAWLYKEENNYKKRVKEKVDALHNIYKAGIIEKKV
jgi:hypothetical protein